MTRAQFLNDMYRRLCGNGMDKDQAEQHLTYYAEMLADRMEEGMSEDQAVASMEDVDTIARRILEEEGLPCRPLEELAAPPAYPDASRLGGGGGGGRRAYQAPKKWSGQKLAQIALWTLAIVIVLCAVSRRLWMRNAVSDTIAEYAPVEDFSVSPIPNAPLSEVYYEDTPYEFGYAYSGGMTSCTGISLKKLDIEWAAGTVLIQSSVGDEIQIQEYSHSELTERNAMVVEEKGDELTIRYRNGSSLGNVKGDKWLTVLVPDGMLEELEIETTSANVWLNGLEQGELDISTSSGDVNLTECYLQTADLETISGDVYLFGVYGQELDISTTSGYVSGDAYCNGVEAKTTSGDISLHTAENTEKAKISTVSGDVWLNVQNFAFQSISLSSTSGDISLSVPYNMGFTLNYSTVSGALTNSFDMEASQNGKYVYNAGGCEITVDTVSGNLDIY